MRIVPVKLQIPEKLAFLMQPATTLPKGGRIKVIHGGRGSTKSESVARAYLARGMAQRKRILCAREVQSSIKESVHQLLSQLIEQQNMGQFYKVQNDAIKGVNGTEFIFKGLKHDSASIKSMQGIDLCWVEEADKVSAASWKYLIPTIRAGFPDPGYAEGEVSEITIVLNPELEDDYTYQEFVVHPPSFAIVQEMNWRDNPFFPAVLEAERMEVYSDPKKRDEYLWIWEGKTRKSLEGAIYANELRDAEEEKRVTRVPYIKGIAVHTFWDLGWADKTAIWFVQRVGQSWHIIDFYENSGCLIDHYLLELQKRSEDFGYVYGIHHLPHDADNNYPGQKRTVATQVRGEGLRQVRIIPRITKKANGINAGRTIFSECWFDREKTADGLNHLRRYRYGVNTSGITSGEPLHDDHSNAADGWQTFGLSAKDPVKKKNKIPVEHNEAGAQGWMAG
jgi:phage terminase large subunit